VGGGETIRSNRGSEQPNAPLALVKPLGLPRFSLPSYDYEKISTQKSNILYKQRQSNKIMKSLISAQSFVNWEIDQTL
jgi:hypothetical protein